MSKPFTSTSNLPQLISDAKVIISGATEMKEGEIGEDYLLHLLLVAKNPQHVALVRKIIINDREYGKLSASIKRLKPDRHIPVMDVAHKILSVCKHLKRYEESKKGTASHIIAEMKSFVPLMSNSDYKSVTQYGGLQKEIDEFKRRYNLTF